ncbi:HAD family phosphatase [Listeria grandensis]|uniref:HAD family phosphatase n=1 Tax=Listeria grandensis TaxID=1494963 RepID=A0A7X0Y3J2_9LIST|nr:Cof-type HAD-IIB family hydrolase [Listeria grandensis]MBC1935974.1 HAD family phosphatase [Listeria grandensis]
MVRLLMLDLDDTLLNDDLELSSVNKATLIKAQQQGIKVALSSGRPTFAMEALAEELELGKYGGYLISFNGAAIYDCKNERSIFHMPLPKGALGELYNISQKYNVYMQTYIENAIVATEYNKYTDIEGDITGMEIVVPRVYDDILEEEVTKVILLENPTMLKHLESKLSPFSEGYLSMTISKPFFLEFMNEGVDKGLALYKLCEHLEILTSEVIAFGDSYNDLPMLNKEAVSVAMGNSVDEVKSVCDYITDTNNNHGVSKFIEDRVFALGASFTAMENG